MTASHYDDKFGGVPITCTYQREQNGVAQALLTADEHIEDDIMLMLGDNNSWANLEDGVKRQRVG